MHHRRSTSFAVLQERGWLEVEEIHSPEQLLNLAEQLGQVVHQESRPVISALKPIPAEAAASATASHRYGTGEFPLHTDLAHWPTPARYLVMANLNVVSQTPTLLLDTKADRALEELRPLAKRAIWSISKARRAFACTIIFGQGKAEGLRWDENVMSPSNPAAEGLVNRLRSALRLSDRVNLPSIRWNHPGRALVVDNWRVLHARPAVPVADHTRTLHRVFVNGE